MVRHVVPSVLISLLSTTLAFASAEWMILKDAQPCRKGGSVSTIAQPYVTAATQAQLEKERAEKAKAKQDQANTALASGAVPQPPGGVKLPPGVVNQTNLVPQWKPGQAWKPGQTAFTPTTPAPGQTVPPPGQIPNAPAGPNRAPRPVNCGRH